MVAISSQRVGPLAPARSMPAVGVVASRRNLGIAFASVASLLTIDGILHPTTRFDVRAINSVQGIDAPYLAQAVAIVETLTSSTWAITFWVLTLLTFAAKRWWLPALAAAVLPIGGLINHIIGEYVVGRTRPDPTVVSRTVADIDAASFPSGHVMGAVMLYGLLFFVARRIERAWLRLLVQAYSAVVIAAVGFARVWEGAHWPTDVLGAYALGGFLLVVLFSVYDRIDAAAGHLPFIHAGDIAHEESTRHAHALTSLVLFNDGTVSKVYNPGFVPRALYWLAFQAPFAYERNDSALRAAMERRNLAAMLTEYWYGSERVARVVSIDRIAGQPALTSTLIDGHTPADRSAAKRFLIDLRSRFDAAGLPTWQIDPRQPRAVDNVLETENGEYMIVDLESGLVSPLASFRSWGRALRSGHVPMFDTVHIAVMREYLSREEPTMRVLMGDAWFESLRSQVDAVEITSEAWYATEPRIWSVLFGVRLWKPRLQARMAGGQDKAMGWLTTSVQTWEDEGRISSGEAADLRARMDTPQFQAVIPHLGAHVVITVLLRFPFGSIARVAWSAWALLTATLKLFARRASMTEWRQAWSIHNPIVIALAAVPGFGAFAYLASGPIRSSRLLVRVTVDAVMFKVPWRLYERTGMRKMIVAGRRAGTFGQVDNTSSSARLRIASIDRMPTGAIAQYPAVESAAWD